MPHSESERPATVDLPECHLCRRGIGFGEPYFPYLIGMEDEPAHVGVPTSVVETTHELAVCFDCNPTVVPMFEALFAALWSLRAEDAPAEATPAVPTEGATLP